MGSAPSILRHLILLVTLVTLLANVTPFSFNEEITLCHSVGDAIACTVLESSTLHGMDLPLHTSCMISILPSSSCSA